MKKIKYGIMGLKYKIAMIQLNTGTDLEENLTKIEELALEAIKDGAKLLSFPEVMNVIQPGGDTPHEEDKNGPTYQLISRLARENRVFIHGGSWSEEIPGDAKKHFNTTFMFDDTGACIAKYRKIHTFDITDPNGKEYRESDTVESGEKVVTVETKLGTFGFAICYDLRFPEIYRLLALKGAQVIFNPANFTMMTGKDHWEPLLRARAIENNLYMVATDQYGENARMLAYGNSMVVDPWGTVIARGRDQEEIIYSEIDLNFLDDVRARMQTLENRRENVYELKELRDEK